jgi:hypothetical protein
MRNRTVIQSHVRTVGNRALASPLPMGLPFGAFTANVAMECSHSHLIYASTDCHLGGNDSGIDTAIDPDPIPRPHRSSSSVRRIRKNRNRSTLAVLLGLPSRMFLPPTFVVSESLGGWA